VKAAEAAVEQVKNDDASTDADLAAARAQLAQATVALSMAKTTAGYASIWAPVPGVVTNKVGDIGENAAPGGTLAVIADTSHLTVTVYIAETDIAKVKVGQKATVTVDSSKVEFPGKVVFIASQAEFTPASVETKDQRAKLVYQVKVSVTNRDGLLKPGMPADVRF
jgi:HlyD family secretion protein